MPYELTSTVVGSYPVPHWLKTMPDRVALRDAILAVLQIQELAGIEVVTDGELPRFDPNHPEANGMIDYFVLRLSGVSSNLNRTEREKYYRQREDLSFRAQPAGVVRERIGEGTLDLKADWEFSRGLTRMPLKLTVTSPFMLARSMFDEFYRDLEAMTMDVAEVLRKQLEDLPAAVVQIDEANLPGHPQNGELASRAINHVLKSVKGEKAVHLCFGNYGGQTVQRGDWKHLLAFFDSLECDYLVLEFARRGYDELPIFRDLHRRIGLGIGVIDIKDNEVESPETVAQRIERATKLLGEGRIRWVHPDCGFWMLPRSVADRKMVALVRGRDLFLGVR